MRAVTEDVHGQTTYPYLKGKFKVVHLRDNSAFVAQLNYCEWVPYTNALRLPYVRCEFREREECCGGGFAWTLP